MGLISFYQAVQDNQVLQVSSCRLLIVLGLHFLTFNVLHGR